ncbi:MAG: hypothetical protein C0622_11440 [Desulfuromonas sp.]|nr:MAG: hypothetical protein C0622_11440 [Desulfuromonas sp.]
MIWLSPAQNTAAGCVYFDIRDIDLSYHGDTPSGVIRGLVGDGSHEIGGEVFIGTGEAARLLPIWSEDGSIESLAGDIDEIQLQQQLLSEVKSFLRDKGLLQRERISSVREPGPVWRRDAGDKLAA